MTAGCQQDQSERIRLLEEMALKHRAQIRRYGEALQRIVQADYRGNRPPGYDIARQALTEQDAADNARIGY